MCGPGSLCEVGEGYDPGREAVTRAGPMRITTFMEQSEAIERILVAGFRLTFAFGTRHAPPERPHRAPEFQSHRGRGGVARPAKSKFPLVYGIPKAWDGKNLISQEVGREYHADYVWRWTPWIEKYLAAVSFAVFGESTLTARLTLRKSEQFDPKRITDLPHVQRPT